INVRNWIQGQLLGGYRHGGIRDGRAIPIPVVLELPRGRGGSPRSAGGTIGRERREEHGDSAWYRLVNCEDRADRETKRDHALDPPNPRRVGPQSYRQPGEPAGSAQRVVFTGAADEEDRLPIRRHKVLEQDLPLQHLQGVVSETEVMAI